MCKYPIAAPTISDLEHEIALQILRVVVGVSSASLFFCKIVYCIAVEPMAWQKVSWQVFEDYG